MALAAVKCTIGLPFRPSNATEGWLAAVAWVRLWPCPLRSVQVARAPAVVNELASRYVTSPLVTGNDCTGAWILSVPPLMLVAPVYAKLLPEVMNIKPAPALVKEPLPLTTLVKAAVAAWL